MQGEPSDIERVCPYCGSTFRKRKNAPGRFCSKPCNLKWHGLRKRKIDPETVRYLNVEKRLPLKDIAAVFGVKPGSIDNIVRRYKMARVRLPETCTFEGCSEPCYRRQKKGYVTGTTCRVHYLERNRKNAQRYRARTITPSTPERRAENGKNAGDIYWRRRAIEMYGEYADLFLTTAKLKAKLKGSK